jgi:hypothetical protein
MAERRSSGQKLLAAYGVASLACVVLGGWIAGAHGVPASVWARNPGAWVLGLAVAAAMGRTAGRRAQAGFLLAAPLGLVATLLAPGLGDVHRWLQLGPLQVNAAEILLPPAVVALSALGGSRRWPWLVAMLVGALLVAQPDASQATAFAGAGVVALALSASARGFRWSGVAIAMAAAAAAWLRPDPLAPVPEVEGILHLAWGLSPFIATLAAATLLAAALIPMVAVQLGAPLSCYFLVSALAPALGAFPVPLVGMGVSPILGAWLGVGVLVAANAPAQPGRSSAQP